MVTDRRSSGHSWRRVKVKSRSYLRVHNATTNVIADDVVGFCLDTWLTGEASEILAYFPQFRESYEAVVAALEDKLIPNYTSEFNAVVTRAAGSRASFYKNIPTTQSKKSVTSLFKRLYEVHEGCVTTTECIALLQAEVNMNVHKFRKFLKVSPSPLIYMRCSSVHVCAVCQLSA